MKKACGLLPPPKLTVNTKFITVPQVTLELTEKINGLPEFVALPDGPIVPYEAAPWVTVIPVVEVVRVALTLVAVVNDGFVICTTRFPVSPGSIVPFPFPVRSVMLVVPTFTFAMAVGLTCCIA